MCFLFVLVINREEKEQRVWPNPRLNVTLYDDSLSVTAFTK